MPHELAGTASRLTRRTRFRYAVPHATPAYSYATRRAAIQFAQRAESLWLLWSSESAEQRRNWIAATLARPDERALRGLLTARRRERLAGVVWYQVQSGRSAAIWPPRLIPNEDPKTADRLITAVEELLDRDQTVVSQSLLRSTTDRDAGLLRRHGYWHAADLLYLVWDSNTSVKHQGELPLRFTLISASDRERLVRLVERTYIDTRDIPALNDVRSVHDVLDGYYQVNPASRLHWFVVQHDGLDIGCLLATEHVENDQWELVYMGLVPEERGRGWGLPCRSLPAEPGGHLPSFSGGAGRRCSERTGHQHVQSRGVLAMGSAERFPADSLPQG